ncbi:PASTA domain-containing protein [Planctomycetota bacterium]
MTLWFQGPPPTQIPLILMRVAGLEGQFGPLSAGQWTFRCQQAKIAFSLSFTVGGGGGGSGNIIYVDKNAPPAIWFPDGSSWTRAFTSLQNALAVAQSGDTLHIADGVYKPDEGSAVTTGDRAASFEIPDNVHLLGGFAGTAAINPNHRDVDANPTVLSGQITVQVPPFIPGFTQVQDNSYHVVSSQGSGTLEGVTVTAGNADGYGDNGYGGGVFLKSSTLLINDCKIHDNRADFGAGVACVEGITPTLLNTEITGNWAHAFGGALYNDDGNVEMTNCLLTGNTASSADILGSDAIYNVMGSLDVTNCTIADNRPGHGLPANGRAIASLVFGPGFVDTISFKNCLIRNGGNEIWSSATGIVTLYYNNIEGGPGAYSGNGNIDQDPLFKNPGVWGIEGGWFFDDDAYTLLVGSPSIDAGNQALIPPGITHDLNGDARMQGANVDQGAYEGFGLPPLPPAVVLVPNVVGQTQANAQSSITSAGLNVGNITQAYHATMPAGRVISQNPAGGSTANVGDAVDLSVSKGPLIPSPGGNWTERLKHTITYNTNPFPRSVLNNITGGGYAYLSFSQTSEVKIEASAVSAAGGTWTAWFDPNPGIVGPGSVRLDFKVEGDNVDFGQIPSGSGSVGLVEWKIYSRPAP